MGQVTIYLDDETDKKMRQAVKKSGLSKSQWVARLIKTKTTTEWPDEIRELAGQWTEFPEQEEIRQTEVQDLPRETL